MQNLVEILKYAPKGTKLWSPVIGPCSFVNVENDSFIWVKTEYNTYEFTKEGYLAKWISCGDCENGECLLFPCKEYNSWNDWQAILFKYGDIIVNVESSKIRCFRSVYSSWNDEGESITIPTYEYYRYADLGEREYYFKELNKNGYHQDEIKKEIVKNEKKPKFHKGDWVVDSQGLTHQIERVVENVTTYTFGYDIVGGGYFNDDSNVHLWSINDAKEGDVLATNSNIVFIYKYLDEGGTIAFRASCTKNSGIYFPKLKEQLCDQDVYPATKEQRDLLFSKMKEVGYEWDYEKKELRKIEQESANKVESKFEIERGKWYVCKTSRYTDFIVGKAYYCPKNGMLKPNENTMARYVARDCFRPWIIDDAKDGDILIGKYGAFIYNGVIDKSHNIERPCAYGGICSEHNFDISYSNNGNNGWTNFPVLPATKEQCNLLFSEMHKEGYEWDEINKKLIKIMTLEEAIEHCEEKSCDNSECGKQHKQLKEWLLELKQYKEFIANRNIENMLLDFESQNNVFKMSIEEIYKKGIVDTLNILKNGKL